MFLVCDEIMHLCRLLFSWSYNQENDTLPIDFLKVSISWYSVATKGDNAGLGIVFAVPLSNVNSLYQSPSLTPSTRDGLPLVLVIFDAGLISIKFNINNIMEWIFQLS